MFRTGPLAIIRSISTLYTRSRYCHAQHCIHAVGIVMLVMLASASR